MNTAANPLAPAVHIPRAIYRGLGYVALVDTADGRTVFPVTSLERLADLLGCRVGIPFSLGRLTVGAGGVDVYTVTAHPDTDVALGREPAPDGVRWVPDGVVAGMIDRGAISDAVTIAAWARWTLSTADRVGIAW